MTSGSREISRRPAFAFERVIGANHMRSGKPCQDEVGGLRGRRHRSRGCG